MCSLPLSPSLSLSQDYPLVVCCPMDLSLVRQKLSEGHYRVPREFIDDVRLIFTNAKEYNQHKSQVCILLYIPDTLLYPSILFMSQYTLAHFSILLHIPVYYFTSQYTLANSSILFHIPVYSCTSQYSLVHPSILLYIPIYSCIFQYTISRLSILLQIPVYSFTFQYTLVHLSILLLISVYSCISQYSTLENAHRNYNKSLAQCVMWN